MKETFMFISDFWLIKALVFALVSIGMFVFVTVMALVLTLVERKLLGWMQQRLGPMEVGPWGLLQPFADAVKILGKGDVIPKAADKFFYCYSPLVSFVPAFVVFAFFPYGHVQFSGMAKPFILTPVNTDVTVLLLASVMSISVIGTLVGGWASGNKFSLLGAMRTAAQEISYEVPKTLAVLSIVILAGTMNMTKLVEAQRVWFIIPQILGFVIFFIASMAEVFRIPFDLAEGESELVAGYNVEYAGIRFVFFFFAEYTYLFVTGAIVTTLYLGGGQGPYFLWGLSTVFWFLVKTMAVVCAILWISRSLPRVKADQLMNIAWKWLVPLSLVNLIITVIISLSPTISQLFVNPM
jgi:NADH-quinone oxidoreductase subunit H